MNTQLSAAALILATGLSTSSALAQQSSTTPPTLAEIAKIQSAEQAKERKARGKDTEAQPLIKAVPSSLLGESTLLVSNGHWAIAPKGSVLHAPTRYKKMLSSTPKGTLISWKEFLRRNKGWLQTVPVTQQQTAGKEQLNPKTLNAYRSMGKVIIATLAHTPVAIPKQNNITAIK